MKKITLSAFMLSLGLSAFSQLTISPNKTASYLASKLVATSGTLGVVISNETLTCDSNANGEFSGVSNLGILDGIALGTGDVASSLTTSTFGLDGLPGDFASSTSGMPGDAMLSAIITATTYDACVLEFDLHPVGNFVEFEYVFGSEEYPEFNCSAFNDLFGFFISGPGFPTPTNIALLPLSTTEVSINTVNDGSISTCPSNTTYYVNNVGTTCTMDGFTVPLIAHANVTPGATYHLKMAIADAMDMVLNSYVILKANSLKTGSTTPSSVSGSSLNKDLSVYPTPMQDLLFIKNNSHDTWELSISDMQNRPLRSQVSNGVLSSIEVQTLPKGMYVLKARNMATNEAIVEKLMKE